MNTRKWQTKLAVALSVCSGVSELIPPDACRFPSPPAGLSTCHRGGDSASLEMTSQPSFPSLGSPGMGLAKTMSEAAWRGEHSGTASGVPSPLLEA